MKTNWTQDELTDEVSRIVGECSAEYPAELQHASATLKDRVRWLMSCEDPPIGDDAELCTAILGGSREAEPSEPRQVTLSEWLAVPEARAD
jgi:hypothetical protein